MVAHLQDEFNGGPDFTFECVGNVHVMRQALESAHKGTSREVSSLKSSVSLIKNYRKLQFARN